MFKELQTISPQNNHILHVPKLHPSCSSGMTENLALLSPICSHYQRVSLRHCALSSLCLLKDLLPHVGNKFFCVDVLKFYFQLVVHAVTF